MREKEKERGGQRERGIRKEREREREREVDRERGIRKEREGGGKG